MSSIGPLVSLFVAAGCSTVPRPHTVTGYGGVVFVADEESGRVVVVDGGQRSVLAEGEDLDPPRRLLLDGGRLVVGGADSVYAVSLSTRERTVLASGTGPVTGLALDHVGYYVVATSRPPWLVRMTPQGERTPLVVGDVQPAGLDFDAAARTLRVTDRRSGAHRTFDYLALVGDDRGSWDRRDTRPMRPFSLHGVELTGAEYWPNRGDTKTRYPQDVLWGFYPEKGIVFEGEVARATPTSAAMACAQTAYDALKAFIDTHHADFLAAVGELGTSSRFYLWVNDYSEANDPFPHEMRPARLWYWERKPRVVGRVVGYWKWESTVTHDGTCRTPQPDQVRAYLAERRLPAR